MLTVTQLSVRILMASGKCGDLGVQFPFPKWKQAPENEKSLRWLQRCTKFVLFSFWAMEAITSSPTRNPSYFFYHLSDIIESIAKTGETTNIFQVTLVKITL